MESGQKFLDIFANKGTLAISYTMLVMNAHYDHYGFRGNANILAWLLGREPTRFADYVSRLWQANKNSGD